MKKCDYLRINEQLENTDIKTSVEIEKKDELNLPAFVKELPTKKRKTENGGFVTIDYDWCHVSTDEIKIKTIEYRNTEDFETLYRINKNDGVDSIVLKHNNRVYVLRKTTKAVALALVNAFERLKGLVENVVGWLKTLLGNVYVITKIDKESWTFDKDLADGSDINVLKIEQLDEKNKEKFCELLVTKLIELQKKGLVLRNFSINNILLANRTLLFADLRNLKLAKKQSTFVEEFRKTLNYLFNIGLATRGDVYAAIAYYVNAMEENCREWYKEKKEREAANQFDIALEIEKTIY
jgi:hypothetical protein